MLRSASLRAASPRTRTRSRSPAPLPKRAPRAPRRSSSVASGLRGSVALAESGTGHGLGHQELPTGPASSVAALTRLSRSSCRFRRVATSRCPSGHSTPSAQVPRATESASNSNDEWDGSPAHGLAPFLGGTAAAVARPAEAAAPAQKRHQEIIEQIKEKADVANKELSQSKEKPSKQKKAATQEKGRKKKWKQQNQMEGDGKRSR